VIQLRCINVAFEYILHYGEASIIACDTVVNNGYTSCSRTGWDLNDDLNAR
jgi:hypothetical protein